MNRQTQKRRLERAGFTQEPKMTRYTAARHRGYEPPSVIQAGDTLSGAKRAATRAFGGELRHDLLVIYDNADGEKAVAERYAYQTRWYAL